MSDHHDTTRSRLPRPVYLVPAGTPSAMAAAEIMASLAPRWELAPAALVLADETAHAGVVDHLRRHLHGRAAAVLEPEAVGEALRSSLHGGDTLVCGGYFLAAEPAGAARFAPALLVNLGPASRLLREPIVRGPLIGVARCFGSDSSARLLGAVAGPTEAQPLRCVQQS